MCIDFNNYKIAGETWVQNTKSNKRTNVVINKKKSAFDENQIEYQLIKKSNKSPSHDKLLGDITIAFENPHCIYVHDLNSYRNEKYKFVGSRLIRVAIEVSRLKKKGGNIELFSIPQALGFYYKIGLESIPDGGFSEYDCKEIDRMVRKELALSQKEHRKPNTEFMEGCSMHLPTHKIQRQLQQIKKSPILFKSHLVV